MVLVPGFGCLTCRSGGSSSSCLGYNTLALKCIPQSDAHFSRFFRSFCRVVWSFSLLISLYKRHSSANSLTDDLTEFGRSFMWHKNSIGPSTVPFGTPSQLWPRQSSHLQVPLAFSFLLGRM